MENKPRVYCFYSKDEVNPHACGDANQFVHIEEYNAKVSQLQERIHGLEKLISEAPALDAETFEQIKTKFRNDYDTWLAITSEALAKYSGPSKAGSGE